MCEGKRNVRHERINPQIQECVYSCFTRYAGPFSLTSADLKPVKNTGILIYVLGVGGLQAEFNENSSGFYFTTKSKERCLVQKSSLFEGLFGLFSLFIISY